MKPLKKFMKAVCVDVSACRAVAASHLLDDSIKRVPLNKMDRQKSYPIKLNFIGGPSYCAASEKIPSYLQSDHFSLFGSFLMLKVMKM